MSDAVLDAVLALDLLAKRRIVDAAYRAARLEAAKQQMNRAVAEVEISMSALADTANMAAEALDEFAAALGRLNSGGTTPNG